MRESEVASKSPPSKIFVPSKVNNESPVTRTVPPSNVASPVIPSAPSGPTTRTADGLTTMFESITPIPVAVMRPRISLVVDSSVTAAEVEAILDRAGSHLLARYDLFDFYEGDKLGTGKKSLAYHLVFQSPTKTLRDKDASKARNRILAELEKGVGARLRE